MGDDMVSLNSTGLRGSSTNGRRHIVQDMVEDSVIVNHSATVVLVYLFLADCRRSQSLCSSSL